MEHRKVVYEKKYKHLESEDYERIESEANQNINLCEHQDSAESCRQLFENTVMFIIPERVENYGFFISMAKEVSEHNEIDTVIEQYQDRYVAEFRISSDDTLFGLKELIQYGDDVCLDCGNGVVVMSVIYYTHATFCSGKRITPASGFFS